MSMICNLLNNNLTLFNNCCPTRYPKKSVKLTGCPLTDLEIIFFKYFEDHGGDKCFCQYFSTAVFNSGMILCAICLSSGKLGWLYKVERYLKIMSQKWSVCSKKSKENKCLCNLLRKLLLPWRSGESRYIRYSVHDSSIMHCLISTTVSNHCSKSATRSHQTSSRTL